MIKDGTTDRDAVWVVGSGGLKEQCISLESPMGRSNFEGEKGQPIVNI